MRRRRPSLYAGFALAAVLVLFITVGRIGGPSDEGERAPQWTPPTEGPPAVGTTDEMPGPEPAAILGVNGRVVGPGGRALGGAQVSIIVIDSGKRREATVRTDPDGRFTERTLTRGKILLVEVLKKGYPTLRHRPKDVEITAGKTVEMDLAVPETFHLAGFVKTSDQRIAEGARVSYDAYVCITDDMGKFLIEGIDSRILKREVQPPLKVRCEGHPDTVLDLDLDGRHANFDDIQVVLR